MKLTILLFLISLNTFAGTNVAIVKLLRGDVKILTLGKTEALKVDQWVENGSVIKTADKSFVKLVFVDKSQMNIGPNAEMKIENFNGKEAGVIDLVKGKIRSQVTKDYLQIQDREKSKLFIKTRNAVMGVRGTDFIISTNGKNTSTILFEGEILFNKFDPRTSSSPAALERVVDSGVRLFPGEFSVMEAARQIPTVPALLNVQQKEKLEKNDQMEANRAPASAKVEHKSLVPAGLTGQLVANDSNTIQKEVNRAEATGSFDTNPTPSSKDPDGYVKGDVMKPANGSLVDLDTGAIIPPGADAVLDNYSNTYVAGTTSSVAADGSVIPSKDTTITADGKVLVTVTNPDGTKVTTVATPVMNTTTTTTSTTTSGSTYRMPSSGTTSTASGGMTATNPDRILSGSSGGLQTNGSGSFGTGTTILIKP